MIPVLIDKQDTSEIVRDQLGAILLSEAASQKALAAASAKDATQWTFRVFTERTNPWGEFMDAWEPQPPVINVTLESVNYPMASSTITGEFINASALFNVDCYGHGMASDDPAEPGHTAGDYMSCLEAQRAARFARNVLTAAEYTYLGLQGTVHRRWLESLSILTPALEGREMQQIVAARLAVRVDFNEFAPQHEGMPLEGITVGVKRKKTGELYFVGTYE